LIDHKIYHIIRVSPNVLQKVWINNVPYFLTPREKPYVFKESVFRSDGEVSISEGYINHGNYNILQIPNSKIARIWIGSTPRLLESSAEPYVFTDQRFRIEMGSKKKEIFLDATDRLIEHGSIKRLLPVTGEVAITYDNGKLLTIQPRDDKLPTIITSPNHKVQGFLPCNVQTIEFPSEKRKKERMKENEVSKQEIDYEDVNYEVFRTGDGLPIGVKLLVVYEIADPNLTLTKLNPDNIMSHIEYLVVADMGTTVQNCSSVDFLRSNQTQVKEQEHNLNDISFYLQLQDKVKIQLHEDFAKYGIKLVRLNIETPKILDHNISSKMAEFSLINTETRARETVLERKYNIARQEASQEAVKKEVAQQQENNNKISAAKAEFEATKLNTESKILQAEGEAKCRELLLEVDRKRAKLYDEYSGLLNYETTKLTNEAVKSISGMIISPDVASMIYNLPIQNFKPISQMLEKKLEVKKKKKNRWEDHTPKHKHN